MKRNLTIGMLLVSCVFFVALGCAYLSPPIETVPVDTDGDGVNDALAVDANNDGVPDTDAQGNILIDSRAQRNRMVGKAAEGIVGEGTLLWTLLGGGGVAAAALALAKKHKLFQVLADTITSVQNVRDKAKKGEPLTLKDIDEILSGQSFATRQAIKKVKFRSNLKKIKAN